MNYINVRKILCKVVLTLMIIGYSHILLSQPTEINRSVNLSKPTLTLEVKHKNQVMNEDTFLYINTTPEMPSMEAMVKSSNNVEANIEIKFSVQFKKYYNSDPNGSVVRDITTHYPVSGYESIASNQRWDIDSVMGMDFRGGKATITWQVKGDTTRHYFVFYIRGTNPTVAQIKTELGDTPWFLKNLCYEESLYEQFNPGDPDTLWTATGACPNWGHPDGWGLMQRDPPPDENFLWNWKYNISSAVAFLNGEKYIIANDRYTDDLMAFNTWNDQHPNDQKNGHVDQVEGNETFAHTPSGDERSFFDAMWIKSYNGNSGGTAGYPGYYYIWKDSGTDFNNPFWDLHRINNQQRNYVQDVCSHNQ